MPANSSQPSAKTLVPWVIWFWLVCSIVFYQFKLGHGWLVGQDARPAFQNPLFWFSIGVVTAANTLRWAIIPFASSTKTLLVLLIIGLALSESVTFYSIFLFPPDTPQTKMFLFGLSLVSALLFAPIYTPKSNSSPS